MRVRKRETPQSPSDAAPTTAPDQVAATEAAATIERRADVVEDGTVPPLSTSQPEAVPLSEGEQLVAEINTFTRALGGEFPEIEDGSQYLVLKNRFLVPIDGALEHARTLGLKSPKDFVIGELSVQLGRIKYGDDRFDSDAVNNSALKMMIDLLDSVSSARAMVVRHPELRESVNLYLTKIWTNIAEQLEKQGAAPLLRTFLLSLVAKATENPLIKTGPVPEDRRELIDGASTRFAMLTEPPPMDGLKALEAKPEHAREVARDRTKLAKVELWPFIAEVLTLVLPKPEAPPAPSKSEGKLVSGDEVRKSRRTRKQNQKPVVDSAMALRSQATDLINALRRNPPFDLATDLNPWSLRKAYAAYVSRGTIRSVEDPDALIRAVLEELLPKKPREVEEPKADRRAATDATPPWSIAFPAKKYGPSLERYFSDAVDVSGSLSGQSGGPWYNPKQWLKDEKDWLLSARTRLDQLRDARSLAGKLSECRGTSHEIGERLEALVMRMSEALSGVASTSSDVARFADELRQSEEKKAPGFMGSYANQTFGAPAPRLAAGIQERIEQARARFESAFQRHAGLMELIGGASNGGGVGGFLKRFLGSSVTFQSVVDASRAVEAAQAPSRALVDDFFEKYPVETKPLRDVLERRLEWRDKHSLQGDDGGSDPRKSDPLLMQIDAMWLPQLACELRRVEQIARRIDVGVKGLPHDLPGREAIERELMFAGDLERGLVAETSKRIAAELSGAQVSSASTRSSVGVVQSRVLPVLARFPRLYTVVKQAGLLNLELKDHPTFKEYVGGAFQGAAKQGNAFRIEDAAQADVDRLDAGRNEYEFWTRTCDLGAPTESFLKEFVGWGTYHKSLIEPYIEIEEEDEGDDPLAADFLKTLTLAAGQEHPIPKSASGVSERDALTQIHALGRGVATSSNASDELVTYLDLSRQPKPVLLAAATQARKVANKEGVSEALHAWLSSPDPDLRAAGRKAIAQLSGEADTALAERLLAKPEEGATAIDPSAIALAVLDIAKSKIGEEEKIGFIARASEAADPLVRVSGAYALFLLAENAGPKPALVEPLAKALLDDEPHVVEFALRGLETMIQKGSAAAAKAVIPLVNAQRIADPRIDHLLEIIAVEHSIPRNISMLAQAARSFRAKNQPAEKASIPKSIELPNARKAENQRKDTSPGDLALAALRLSRGKPATIEELNAVAARLKLAVSAMRKFQAWRTKEAPRELEQAFTALDLPDAILDDAIADISGREPKGYLQKSPQILDALLKAPHFTGAEIDVLTNGKLSPQLGELAHHALAKNGSWQGVELRSLRDKAEDYFVAAKLKGTLGEDRAGLWASLIADVLDPATPVKTSRLACRVVRSQTGVDISFLDARRTLEARESSLAALVRPKGAVGELLHQAVLEHFFKLDPELPEASVFVRFLGAGSDIDAERSLGAAVDAAPSRAFVELLLEACRTKAQSRSLARRNSVLQTVGGGADEPPWIIRLLEENPKLDAEKVLAIRDALSDAREHTGDPADERKVEERFVELINHALDGRALSASDLEVLGGILADSDTDRCRQAKVQGLTKIFGNPRAVLDSERIAALRSGLLTVAANLRYGDASSNLTEFLNLIFKVHAVRPDLATDEMKKLGEMYAGCPTHQARQTFAESISKLYRLSENRLEKIDLKFLGELDRWFTASNGGRSSGEQERHREIILNNLGAIVPVSPETMTALVNGLSGQSNVTLQDVMNLLKERKRTGNLTPEVIDEVLKMKQGEEVKPSRFAQFFGLKMPSFTWRPSEFSPYADPIAIRYGDDSNLRWSKQSLKTSITDVLNQMNARRLAVPDIQPLEDLNAGVGQFALGSFIRTSTAERSYTKQLDNPNFLENIAAQRKSSEQMIDAFRKQEMSQQRPFLQMAYLNDPSIRQLRMSIDAELDTTPSEELEPTTSPSSKMNTQAWAKWKIMQRHANENADENDDDVGGVAKPAIYLSNVSASQASEKPLLCIIAALDCSGSMNDDNRIGYAKQQLVKLIETNEGIENAEIHTGLIVYNDRARLILSPEHKHELSVKAGAIEAIKAGGQTNDVAATQLIVDLVKKMSADRAARGLRPYTGVAVIFYTDGLGQQSQGAAIELARQEQGILFGAMGTSSDAQYVTKTYPIAMCADTPADADRAMYKFYKDDLLDAVRK